MKKSMKTKMNEEQVQRLNQQTHDDYWDCECDKNYIHAKSRGTYCSLCKSPEDSMPDSRVLEIYEQYDPDLDTAVKQ